MDGGNTKLADFGQSSDPSDFLNSGVQGPNDPFNEYYTGSTLQSLTTADKQLMDALGFHTMTPVATTVIEAFGSTSLVEVGPYFYLDSISSGSGPELKYAGTPVVAGQFGPWAPTGYEVAWKVAGADQYGVWYTDSSGNFISNTAVMSGTSATLESLETSFHQDLNGDGVIGIPTTVIESFGSTSLVEVGNNFYLKSISSGTSVELQNGGVPVVAGGSGAWTPIAAEVTATGYEVAWKLTGADQYSVWNTDSNGNYVSNMIGVVSGSSTVLQSLEPSFHQDLKGDSVIGPAPSAAAASHFGASNVASFVFNASGTSPNLSPPGTPDKEVIFASGYQDVLTGAAVQHTITDFVSGLDSRP